MSRRSWVTCFLSLLVICLNVLPASSQTAFSTDMKPRQAITPATDPLQTYQRMYSLSPGQSRALFSKASAQEKSDLWRLHLALSLAGRFSLERQQQEVVLQAISLATPESFEISRSDPLWQKVVDEPLQRLRHDALEVFSKEQAAEILAQIPSQSRQYLEDNVIETYSSLDSLSMAERKGLVARASARQTSDLWRLHLSLALIRTPNLSHEQQAVILSAIVLAAPSLFDTRNGDPTLKSNTEGSLQTLQASALSVFSKDDAVKIFATLGKPIPPLRTVTALSAFVKTSWALPDCSCSTQSDWCNTICTGTGSCEHSESGCGTLWQYSCNGQCFVYRFMD